MNNPILKIFGKALTAYRNQRDPIDAARALGVKIGTGCRFAGRNHFGSEPYLITLGDCVSVSHSSFITHDGGVWVFRGEFPDVDVIAPIVVGNNVFIGRDCMILPGVTIGNNVVIGARSIVSRDIPDDCVAAGVPCKPIKTLHEYKEKVLKFSINTKGMGKEQKKRVLLERYGS